MKYIINISNDDATYQIVDNNLLIIPNLNYNGNIYVTISASDGIYTDSGLFILEILPVNDAPEIISTPNSLTNSEDFVTSSIAFL